MSVQSIERAFAILRTIAAHPGGIGVTAVAQQVNLHKSTVSRLLSTLEAVAAVERLPGGDGFCIGPGILSLAAQVPYAQSLITAARPFLLELAEVTGETAGLSVPDGDEILYVDQVQSEHHVRVRDWTGERYPLHVVSAGKLSLAYRSQDAMERYLARPLARYASHTLTEPAALRQRLAAVRGQGYDWSVDEFEDGLAAVAAPIVGATYTRLVAAVYLCGPTYRFPPAGRKEAITDLVVAAAREISEWMGENRTDLGGTNGNG